MKTIFKNTGIRTLLLVCVLFITMISGVCLNAETVSASGKQKQRQTVRVGFFPFPGYHEMDANGKKSGYGYDYLQNLARYVAWKYDWIGVDCHWAAMFSMLESGEIDFFSYVHKTPERLKKYAFSRNPVGYSAAILTVRAGETRYRQGDYANWNGMRVGLMRENAQNASFTALAAEKGFTYTPVYYDSIVTLLKDLRSGKNIDAAVSSNLRKFSGEWIYEQFDFAPFYIIVRKDNQALLRKIDEAMDQLNLMSPQTSAVLWNRYYAHEDAAKISYTREENDFIQRAQTDKKVFTATINPDRKPFSYYENGKLKGILSELSAEIIKRTGLTVKIIPQKNRKEYYKSTLNPDVTLVLDSLNDYSVAEQKNLILCGEYFDAGVSILRRKIFSGNPQSIACVEGSDLLLTVAALTAPQAKLVYYGSTAEAVEAVVKGKQDCAILSTRAAEYAVADDRYEILAAYSIPSVLSNYSIGIRDNTNPLLTTIFSKAICSINRDFAADIKAKYADIHHPALTLGRFIHSNPKFSFSIPLVILLLIVLLLSLLLFIRRKMVRRAEIIKLLPLHYCVVAESGKFLDLSYGANSPDEENSQSLNSDMIPEYIKKMIQEHCASVIKNAKPETFNYENNGIKRTAMISKLPYRIFNQNAAVWISQDTSELQNSRKEAQNLAEYFRLTLHSIGDGVIVTDDQGNISMMNPVAEQIIGCANMKYIGRTHEEFFRIVSYIDDSPVSSPVRKSLESGEVVELANHTDLLSFSGARYHIADSSAPIKGPDGKIIGVILVFRNVTAEYESRDKLVAALTSLEISTEMMNSASFQIDPETLEMSGSKHLNELWPVNNGIAIPYWERILPEDKPLFENMLKQLGEDKVPQVVLEFHAYQNGVLRYYRLCAERDRTSCKSLRLIGAIQDLTEITATAVKLKESQHLWNIVASAIPVMLFVKNADDNLRYILTNEANQKLVGHTAEELIGRCDAEIFRDSKNAEQFVECDRKIIEKGVPQTFFEDVVNVDNQLRHLQTTKIPFKGVHGEQLLLGVSSDVTELHDLLQNQTLINACLEALFLDGSSVDAIKTVIRLLTEHLGATRGYVLQIDSDRMVESVFTEYCPSGLSPIFDDCVNVPFSRQDPWFQSFEKRKALHLTNLKNWDERKLLGSWADFACEHDIHSATLDAIFLNGKIWGDIGVIYEHTPKNQITDAERSLLSTVAKFIELMLERQQSRDQLLEAARQAQAADKAKSFFIASVSHEIRTPLNAVIGFAELLCDGISDERAQKEYLENIATSGKALLELINDVLDLSKLEAGQLTFSPEETDFKQLALEVGSVFRLTRERKGLRAVYDIAPMPILYLDKLRLRQILFNLMGNALKFTQEGLLTLHATFTKNSDKVGTLIIDVIDTGVGISEEDQKILFEPFVQAKAMRGTYAATRGTGLGLAICRRMTEKMNGTIKLKSKPGQGSTFSVILTNLPYRETNDPLLQIGEAAEETLMEENQKILLVDDIKMNLQVLSAMLMKLGYHPLKASSGSEALALLEKNECDLVLTDLWMPEMNGAELANAIRNNPEYKHLHLIAVTADVESGLTFDMGCFDDVLTKPVSLDKLKTAIEAVTSMKQNESKR